MGSETEHMNPNDIEAFIAIAEAKSLSKAAARLYLTQSAVSYRLKLLESDLGFELFERGHGGKQSTLTARGEAFLPLAERYLELNRDMETFKKSPESQGLSIGCVDSVNLFLFDSLYTQFGREHPECTLYLRTHNNGLLYRTMDQGRLDIAYTVDHIRHKTIVTTPLFSETMYLVSSPDYELPEGPVHPQQLRPEDELSINWESDSYHLWHDHWWHPGTKPHLHTNSQSFAYRYIQENSCWMTVPASMAFRLSGKKCTVRQLKEAPPKRVCYEIEPRYPHYAAPKTVEMWKNAVLEYISKFPWIEIEKKI